MKEIKGDAWRKFVDVIDFESNDRNFKMEFKDITKKFGNAYIEYCKAMWSVNEGVQTEEEFCKMNGNMPMGFFNKVIKNG